MLKSPALLQSRSLHLRGGGRCGHVAPGDPDQPAVVEPLAFSWVDPKAVTVSHAEELVRAEGEDAVAKDPRYDFMDVRSLPDHAGKRLQFITYEGTYYQGVLHKVENGKVFLTVQMGTGSAEMFLRLEKIDKVRVLF